MTELHTALNLSRSEPPRSGIGRALKEALRERKMVPTAIALIRSHIGIFGNVPTDQLAEYHSHLGDREHRTGHNQDTASEAQTGIDTSFPLTPGSGTGGAHRRHGHSMSARLPILPDPAGNPARPGTTSSSPAPDTEHTGQSFAAARTLGQNWTPQTGPRKDTTHPMTR